MAICTLSICAGIGGIDLGLRRAMGQDYRTVCYIEREAHAAAVLVKNMQEGALCDAPVWSDVTTFDPEPWRGRVDCITAGYPCQPFSCAGQRKGEADPRHLWPHIRRIIAELKPAQCFFENVPGHVTLGLEQVATDLQTMGYDVSCGIFSAAQVGAPHVRKRLFILADSDRARQLQPQGSESAQRRWLGNGSKDVANPNSQQARWTAEPRRKSNQWAIEPAVGRVANGVSNRVDKLRALGNAVVPATAELAWSILNQC